MGRDGGHKSISDIYKGIVPGANTLSGQDRFEGNRTNSREDKFSRIPWSIRKSQKFIPILKECQNSKEMREIINVDMLEHAGVSPGSSSFFWLVSKMVDEGDTHNANEVLNKEMPAVGLKPEFWMRPLARHLQNVNEDK